MSNEEPAVYALLVGIDDYRSPSVPDLRGCVNDVDAMAQVLRDRFAVPQEQIRTLTNEEATHEAIKVAFREHLIGNVHAWTDAGSDDPPPAVLFHYSGHGSQALDETGTEPDGLDETIVPHDSRTEGVYDIKDWELGQLLDELTALTDNVTVVLDCCHSGSGTRVIETPAVRARRCEPDLRPQPTQRPETLQAGRTRAIVPPSGWTLGEQYVLLAGCRDRELSHEYAVREGDRYRHHGALTYFLTRELGALSADRPLTYRELHERVRYAVNSVYEEQMPQCEGDRDREVFGGVRPARGTFLTVVDKSEGYIWVSGGVAHGLTEGSQLRVYPPDVRTRADADAAGPIATLRVEEVGVVRSGCTVEDGQADVPLHARVAVHRLNFGNMQRRVALDVSDDATRDALVAALTDEDVAPYATIVSADTPADFRVEQVGDRLEIVDDAGTLLVAPFSLDASTELAEDLSHLVRYRNALELRNTADFSELAGALELSIKELAFDPDTQEPVARPIEPAPGGELIIETGRLLVIEVTNLADVPLYFSIFAFNHDWSITLLYPQTRGAHEPLAPGATYSIGLTRTRRKQLQANLPAEVSDARQIVKVIATVEPTDFEVLTQGGLKMPYTKRLTPRTDNALSRLLVQATIGGDTRALGPPPSSVEDEWTTAQASFRLIHAPDSTTVTHRLRGGTTTTLRGYDLAVEAPAGFTGTVRVLTHRQTTRAMGDSTDLEPPPGLAGFADQFRPMPVPQTGMRSVGAAGAVIEIDADDFAREQITPEQPLRLHVPADLIEDGAAFVLAYDGSFYFPVGRAGDTADTLNVEWLPPSAPEDETPLRSTRNLGRTVKLYLFKTFKLEEPSLGVHRARYVSSDVAASTPLDDGEYRRDVKGGGVVRYWPLREGDVQAGQRVALFVHGFSSESTWMVSGPAEWLRDKGVHYDHVLTFDYESFNTPIAEHGETLAEELRLAGFGADDGIHLDIFAHSMGAAVVRSMVEQWMGNTLVDRCFLAGPPNKGSPLAEAQRLIPWLGTMLLNKAGPTPPTLIASWALKRVADDAVGIKDIHPGSEFLSTLNTPSDEEPAVPYYLLAGRNELSPEEMSEWDRFRIKMEQGIDAALDFIFKDQNDLVISVDSMQTVRGGQYPEALLTVKLVPCDHFEYFVHNDAQQQLLGWLNAGG